MSIIIFVVGVSLFLGLICYVGARAKKKLMALDDEDAQEAAEQELTGLEGGDDAAPVGRITAHPEGP